MNLNNDYTISFWINTKVINVGTMIRLASGVSNSTLLNKYEIRLTTSGAILFITGNGATSDSDSFASNIVANTWVQITCTLQTRPLVNKV